jgi:nucleoside-diphosphate-sugar epimerase
MASALIGHTGFVGSNLARQFTFDECYNSKNIGDIRGREFDLLVSAGVSAVKWWANQNAAEDRARIDSLLADLAEMRARRVVVLSTVDVYPLNSGVDESFDCHSRPNHAYGVNRLHFEDAMRERFDNTTVVRIGGVFGSGLKKNVIYDLLHDNCLEMINPGSSFQYYNVGRLWRDLEWLERTGIRLINFVTEPIATREILDRFFPGKPVGAKPSAEAHYDVRTLHSREFGTAPGYLATAEEVLTELGEFVKAA